MRVHRQPLSFTAEASFASVFWLFFPLGSELAAPTEDIALATSASEGSCQTFNVLSHDAEQKVALSAATAWTEPSCPEYWKIGATLRDLASAEPFLLTIPQDLREKSFDPVKATVASEPSDAQAQHVTASK
eukprot:CAMPEP_0184319866 /NCGR_PEP_ID=MMETSP1049-20130417/111047_1 /TAXON_ID=77928 /ORGANISM="Proteomonas sulcata, Strain CCMP704" /LENGTH=130 /DNA_ID=CAMNT_0026640183 /DNA_START=503 /DNA_END=895 /DNA_ORIENTATION=-